MAKAGRLGRFNQWYNKVPPKKVAHASLSEYSFIDLAQIVCKLPETNITHVEDENAYIYSEDEDYDGYISEPSSLTRVRLCLLFQLYNTYLYIFLIVKIVIIESL